MKRRKYKITKKMCTTFLNAWFYRYHQDKVLTRKQPLVKVTMKQIGAFYPRFAIPIKKEPSHGTEYYVWELTADGRRFFDFWIEKLTKPKDFKWLTGMDYQWVLKLVPTYLEDYVFGDAYQVSNEVFNEPEQRTIKARS